MSLAYLFDSNIQFQDKSGNNNVNGFLRVYIDNTDDRAVTYKDFNGTLNQADIRLDNNGRAVVIVDDSKTYRLEVYGTTGVLLWTLYPISPKATGINETLAALVAAVKSHTIAIEGLALGKKNKQQAKLISGTPTQTVKSITQNADGEINVEFEDIEFPYNINISSPDDSIEVGTPVVDPVRKEETIPLSVKHPGLVKADSEDTEPGTLIDKLEVVDNVRDPEDPDDHPILSLETIVDGQGNRKVAINEDNLRNFADTISNEVLNVIDTLDSMDFDAVPHGAFGSSLNQSPGDGTTTSIQVSIFRPIEATVGDAISWTKTTEIGGEDFGTVTLEPGTYIICSDITCQWVGVPAGTYLPQVGNVLGEPFDFSQQQELHRRMTNVVTVSTTTQFKMKISFDAATPVMGFWINAAQIVKIAGGMSQTNVTHDSTLVGQGSVADPLGVDEAKVAQSTLAGKVAEDYIPGTTNAVAGKLYVYGGVQYMCKENTSGDWDASKFEMTNIDALFAQSVLPNNFISRNLLNVFQVYGAKPVELHCTTVSDKMLRRDGTLRDKTEFNVNYYNIENVKAVLISGRQGAGTDYSAIACFYNSTETFDNTTIVSSVVLGEKTSYSNYALEVPADAKVIAVTDSYHINSSCFGLDIKDIMVDIPEQSVSSDKLLRSNGSLIDYSRFNVNYYNVEDVNAISISGRQGQYTDFAAIACFYNSTETFDSSTLISPVILEERTTYSNYVLEVPADAKVIAVCGSEQLLNAPIMCKRAISKSVITDITTDISKNTNDIDRINYELFSNITQAQLLSTENNSLLRNNGTLKNETGFNVKYYNVEGAKAVLINGRQGAYADFAAISCFYNSTETFNNTTIVSSVILEERTSYEGVKVEVPTGAKVIAVTGSWHISSSCNVIDLSGNIINDINNRLDSIENDKQLPDYWISHIDSRTQDILSYLDTLDPSKYDSFVFVTDLHYPEFSFGRTFNITSYLLQHLPTSKLFVGGDIIQTTTSFNTKYKELTDKIADRYRVFAVRGNHDVSNKQYFYPHFFAKLDEVLDCDGMQSKLYYFVDNKSKKIRYIFCDSNNPDSGSIDQTQLDWISSKITELAVGWSVILITHGLWIAANKDTSITQHTVDYTRLTGLLDSLYDVVGASIIGIISGHCHRDWSETAQKGYVMIGTTCDANGYMANTFDPVAPTRTTGTVTENAMDYFIIDTQNKVIKAFRIGAGNDRVFNFA